jgi:hypothetical protein
LKMPLGFIAKDSFVNLTALARESEAARQKKEDATPPTGQYAGFQVDYPPHQHHYDSINLYDRLKGAPVPQQQEQDDDADNDLPTSTPVILGDNSHLTLVGNNGSPQETFQRFFTCLVLCLFPWQQETRNNQQSSSLSIPVAATRSAPTEALPPPAPPHDENALGELLSAREQQAVLARLGLAQPDAVVTEEASVVEEDSENLVDRPSLDISSSTDGSMESGLNNLAGTSPPRDRAIAAALLASPLLRKPVKGILKRGGATSKHNKPLLAAANHNSSSTVSSVDSDNVKVAAAAGPLTAPVGVKTPPSRRSLFARYENINGSLARLNVDGTNSSSSPVSTAAEAIRRLQKPLNVSFANMARVITIKSKNDMTEEEKAGIWFQKSDYEDFRKTGRIITRAMLEGGSEIWLASSSSTISSPTSAIISNVPAPKKLVLSNSTGSAGSLGSGSSSTTTQSTMSSVSSSSTISSSASNASRADSDPADTISATGDKWWHKFGHSRRGLEHVVSMDEGRQRQANVRNAIRAVVQEQARQRLVHRGAKPVDAEKLRSVSLQHTTWARDLALASGASDADAVLSNFDKDRKSREFFLLKMAKSNPTINRDRAIPEFMQPAMRAGGMLQHHTPTTTVRKQPTTTVGTGAGSLIQLDSNTASQIAYRRSQLKSAQQVSKPADLLGSARMTEEPIHDEPSLSNATMKQRAAGFTPDQDDGHKDDMSAVLSGMGVVRKQAAGKGNGSNGTSAAPSSSTRATDGSSLSPSQSVAIRAN